MNTSQVYVWLSAESTVTAALGSPPRIYPVIAPEGVSGSGGASSWVTYLGASGTPENTLGGFAGMDRVRVQFDAYAATYEDAKALSETIAAALDTRGFVVGFNGETYDLDVRKFRRSFDFEFFATR